MGHNIVLKLAKSVVRKSTKGAKVVKSIGKSGALQIDRLADRVLEKSSALLAFDHLLSSAYHAMLPQRHLSRHQYPPILLTQQEEEDKKKKEEGCQPLSLAKVQTPPQRVRSFHNRLSSSTSSFITSVFEDGEECRRGTRLSLDYSTFTQDEFKEMVESFIERFNHRLAQESYSENRESHEIVLVGSPLTLEHIHAPHAYADVVGDVL